MLSTVRSPIFSDVVVVYHSDDFYNVRYSNFTARRAGLGDEGGWYHPQFEVFREMYKVRSFRLVLSARRVSDNSVRELKRAVAAETAKGGLPPELSVRWTLMAH